jgi:hypothetical protein
MMIAGRHISFLPLELMTVLFWLIVMVIWHFVDGQNPGMPELLRIFLLRVERIFCLK